MLLWRGGGRGAGCDGVVGPPQVFFGASPGFRRGPTLGRHCSLWNGRWDVKIGIREQLGTGNPNLVTKMWVSMVAVAVH